MRTEPREAAAAYRQCLRLNPENVVAHNNLGWELLKYGEIDEAEDCFRQVLVLSPGHPTARTARGNLALVHRLRDDYDAADGIVRDVREEKLQRARDKVTRSPKDPAARDDLIMALWSSRRRDEAWVELRAALRQYPGHRELWESLAALSIFRGRYRLAIYACRRALAVDPGDAIALGFETQAYTFLGRARDAEETAARLEAVASGTHLAERALGDARLAAGDWQQAAVHFRRSIELQPVCCCCTARLGIALRRAGDFNGAEHTWLRRQQLGALDCGCAMLRGFAELLGKEVP